MSAPKSFHNALCLQCVVALIGKVFIVIGDGDEFYHELIDHGYPDGNEKALWTKVLESCKSSSAVKLPLKNVYMPVENVSIALTY